MTTLEQQAYTLSLDCQDACNPVAVANHFARLTTELFHENQNMDAIRNHPALCLFVDKLHSMFNDDFSANYAKVQEVCNHDKP